MRLISIRDYKRLARKLVSRGQLAIHVRKRTLRRILICMYVQYVLIELTIYVATSCNYSIMLCSCIKMSFKYLASYM